MFKTSMILASVGALVLATQAWAVPSAPLLSTVTVDENGHGVYFNAANGQASALGGGLRLEPISGMTTLAYLLPFNATSGDVLLGEPGGTGALVVSDLLRFEAFVDEGAAVADPTPSGFTWLYFFSDPPELGEAGDLADVGIPAFRFETLVIAEVGPEGANGAVYLPDDNEPGYNGTFSVPDLQYTFISDAPETSRNPVPEPAMIALQACGAGAAILAWMRRRRAV